MGAVNAVPKRTIRCAIYTRKSTEEGLDQEFSSLDAQRECAEAYIQSQRAEGWIARPKHYDDGGFTGANLERPALRELLADVEAGELDCIVVYKVDRLSRSLLDFARLMEVFDRRKVTFVSVTQQLNSYSPMGRLKFFVNQVSFMDFQQRGHGPPSAHPWNWRYRGTFGARPPMRQTVTRTTKTPSDAPMTNRGDQCVHCEKLVPAYWN